MLTGGAAAPSLASWDFDGAAGLGLHRRAAMMMLAIWNTKAVPQKDAAATAGTVMGVSQ
jgi:hypothetical protein